MCYLKRLGEQIDTLFENPTLEQFLQCPVNSRCMASKKCSEVEDVSPHSVSPSTASTTASPRSQECESVLVQPLAVQALHVEPQLLPSAPPPSPPAAGDTSERTFTARAWDWKPAMSEDAAKLGVTSQLTFPSVESPAKPSLNWNCGMPAQDCSPRRAVATSALSCPVTRQPDIGFRTWRADSEDRGQLQKASDARGIVHNCAPWSESQRRSLSMEREVLITSTPTPSSIVHGVGTSQPVSMSRLPATHTPCTHWPSDQSRSAAKPGTNIRPMYSISSASKWKPSALVSVSAPHQLPSRVHIVSQAPRRRSLSTEPLPIRGTVVHTVKRSLSSEEILPMGIRSDLQPRLMQRFHVIPLPTARLW